MADGPWSAWLTVALVPVVLWCTLELARSVRDRGARPIPVDVIAWHGVMGAVMLVGLWWTVSASWQWAGAAVFASAVAWCAFRVSIRGSLGRYARLCLMSAAMALMLMPAGAATAAPAGPSTSMPGMSHAAGGPGMPLSGPTAVVIALGLTLVALAAIRVAAHRHTACGRLSACCEAVMSGAMAVLALGMV
jgi:hypothetical protein